MTIFPSPPCVCGFPDAGHDCSLDKELSQLCSGGQLQTWRLTVTKSNEGMRTPEFSACVPVTWQMRVVALEIQTHSRLQRWHFQKGSTASPDMTEMSASYEAVRGKLSGLN
jgi:hypothetical protein